MPQVLIHPPSSFAEEHHRLKHQLIRHYAYRFRLQYNFMSNRLLDDLSYNFVTRLLDAEIPIDEVINLEVEDPVAYANHLEKTIKMAKGASLAFMKSFMSAAVEEAQDGKVLSEEWILIVKEKGITTATSRFANLLAEAIGNVSKHVAVARSFETATNPIVDPHSIRLIYGEEANNEIVEGGVLGGNIRNSNLKFHRIIHICSPDSDTLETQAMEDLLPDGAVDGDVAHYGTYIRTILAPTPDRRVFPIRTIEIEKNWDEPDYRIYRDMSVLTSDPESSILLPENPLISELNRWARNVTYLQVGFATSGGGASAFRTIAILETMAHKGLWVDVFAGLSGGAVIGAFLAADEANGLDRVVNKAKKSGPILPSTMISTKPIEHLVNEELGFKRVGQTSLRFGAATAELCNDGDKPARQIIREGTLGQAVRASGALPILFAPCSVDGRRFTDGMAATIVPTDVAIEHGADIVLSVNCIPGPDRTNPYDESLLGRLAYLTPIGRAIDSWTWISFLVQNASKAYAHGADVFFEFLPDKISSMEPVKWWQADKIRDAAWNEQARIIDAVEDLRDVWIKKHKAITGQDYTNFPP